MNTGKALRVTISAIVAGAMATVGALTSLVLAAEPGSSISDIPELGLLAAALTGVSLALKDIHAALKNFEDHSDEN